MWKDDPVRRKVSMLKVAVPVSALLLLVSCGGGDGSSNPDGSSVDSASTPDTTFPLDYVPDSMVTMFAENDIFSTFAELVQLTDLAPLFGVEGEITIFLPTDKAFSELPAGVLDKLKAPENRELLTRIISYHILDGNVPEFEIQTGLLVTKSGDSVEAVAGAQPGQTGNLSINGISIPVGDLVAGKSVAHVLVGVLLPPGVDLSAL